MHHLFGGVKRWIEALHLPKPRPWMAALVEIALIIAWAIFAGRQYLDFSADTWLYGSDYPLQILDYYTWEPLTECGACVFWNGWVSGGWPAFGDFFGGHLHPLVFLAAVILGPISASKVIVVAGMALAGIAQWWLARIMRLGLTARLWVAGLAVVGGQLSGRMDMGLVIMLFSVASTSLVLAPLVEFGLTGRRRPAVWLGVMLGLALLSGQGYMQLGLLFGLAPAALILFWGEPMRRWQTRWNILLAGGLAALISAVNFLPLVRFWGNIDKAGDPYFAGAQPIPFIPLNMLIADYGFYTTDALLKKPFPAFYMNYIGWVPVALALLTFLWVPRKARRVWFFFIGALFFVYLASSGSLFRILVGDLTFLSGARHPALISPLSIPLVLGLAAWGLDLLVKRLDLPRLGSSLLSGGQAVLVPMVILGAALVLGISTVYTFSRHWKLVPIPETRLAAVAAVEALLEPGAAQWVQYPPGDLSLATVLVGAGYKVNIDAGHRNAGWRGRSLPAAYLTVENGAVADGTPGLAAVVGETYSLVIQPENQYAQVVSQQGNTPCEAKAMGGDIDVTCDAPEGGTLVVLENMFDGWKAWRDSEPVMLKGTEWLAVEALPGEHTYRFRYRPWDAVVGVILSLLGWLLVVGLAFLPDPAGYGDPAAVFTLPSQPAEPTPAPMSDAATQPESPEKLPRPGMEPAAAPTAAADVRVQATASPIVSGFVHVDIDLELPAGTEAVIDITCQADGALEIRQE